MPNEPRSNDRSPGVPGRPQRPRSEADAAGPDVAAAPRTTADAEAAVAEADVSAGKAAGTEPVAAKSAPAADADGGTTSIDVDLEVEADSPQEIAEFLEKARLALLAEGFRATPFQYRKKGQAFGLIKDHGHELQLHVRAFTNGIIESEVELSNRYIEHLVSPRRSAHAEIKAIFEKHDVPTKTINEEFRTRTGADRIAMPRTRTRRSVAGAGAALAGAVAYAWFARRGRGEKRR